jgi:hypothetical protein
VAKGELSAPEAISNVARETVGKGLRTAAGMGLAAIDGRLPAGPERR